MHCLFKSQRCKAGAIILLIWMKKSRLKYIRWLSQGYTARNGRAWRLAPELLASENNKCKLCRAFFSPKSSGCHSNTPVVILYRGTSACLGGILAARDAVFMAAAFPVNGLKKSWELWLSRKWCKIFILVNRPQRALQMEKWRSVGFSVDTDF